MAWLKVKTCLLAIPDFKIVHVECRFVVEGFSADTIEGNVHDDFGVAKRCRVALSVSAANEFPINEDL